MCSYFSQDIRPDQINHTLLRIPLVIVTIVPFLNNLDILWCSVKMAHCGGFVRKPRKRLESTQCSCTSACCGDGCVSLLLYQGACCLGLLVLKFKCIARPPYYLSTFTSHCSEWSWYSYNQRNRKASALQSLDSLPQSFSDWFEIQARSIWCWSKIF